MTRAIAVLRKAFVDRPIPPPPITASSTGAMLNHARDLVRKAS